MDWMYHHSFYSPLHQNSSLFGIGDGNFLFYITPLIVWSLVWKGWALWLAARRGETPWFIGLLVLNTLGLLEIFYIFAIAKQKDTKEEVTSNSPRKETVTSTKEQIAEQTPEKAHTDKPE